MLDGIAQRDFDLRADNFEADLKSSSDATFLDRFMEQQASDAAAFDEVMQKGWEFIKGFDEGLMPGFEKLDGGGPMTVPRAVGQVAAGTLMAVAGAVAMFGGPLLSITSGGGGTGPVGVVAGSVASAVTGAVVAERGLKAIAKGLLNLAVAATGGGAGGGATKGAGGGRYPSDRATGNTKNFSAKFNSEGEARAFARQKVGRDPVEVEPGKLRSQDGRWQYRAKPNDLMGHGAGDSPHVHLEQLDPATGEVLQNWHLRW
jgi:hypothetical protein